MVGAASASSAGNRWTMRLDTTDVGELSGAASLSLAGGLWLLLTFGFETIGTLAPASVDGGAASAGNSGTKSLTVPLREEPEEASLRDSPARRGADASRLTTGNGEAASAVDGADRAGSMVNTV